MGKCFKVGPWNWVEERDGWVFFVFWLVRGLFWSSNGCDGFFLGRVSVWVIGFEGTKNWPKGSKLTHLFFGAKGYFHCSHVSSPQLVILP